jgi:hypothetical protein
LAELAGDADDAGGTWADAVAFGVALGETLGRTATLVGVALGFAEAAAAVASGAEAEVGGARTASSLDGAPEASCSGGDASPTWALDSGGATAGRGGTLRSEK